MTNITRNRADTGLSVTPPPALRGRRAALVARFRPATLVVTLCLFALASRGAAIDLKLPGNARETAQVVTSPESHALAIGAVSDGALDTLDIDGRVSRTAWRVAAQGITTLQLLGPLREQLLAAGFEIMFECKDFACGGFDFRYRLKVFPEPMMHVDLFDYRYLAAVRLTEGKDNANAGEYVALLVSRSANAGFLQIVQITPSDGIAPQPVPSGKPATSAGVVPGADRSMIAQLTETGHSVLADLAFDTGSSSLGDGPFDSLKTLAAFLRADPKRRVALVGHTDATGALDTNIALSRRRATSVMERLVVAYGVPRGQLEAEGMGYLAPITTNLDPEGRERNRRVEAVLLNTE